MSKLTFYDMLGLPRDATQEEIRRAYRQLVRRLHPDKNVKAGETELFIDIQQAYENLTDSHKKEIYDQHLPPEPDLSSPLEIKTIYSRDSLARLPEPQLLYALLELSINRQVNLSPPVASLNISLVVDCSTSMQGLRLDTVKLAAIDILRQLRPNDIFSLVKFNDWAELLITPGSITDLKSSEMKVQLLQAGGGTEIYKGLDMGFSQVTKFYSQELVNHIILITDGRTYGDELSCENLASHASAIGVGISALGIGSQWNDKFLDHITSKTGGICKFISESSDLRNSLLEEIARLGSNLAEQVSINFHSSTDVELSSAYRLIPDLSPLDTNSPIILGNLPRQGNLSVIFEFVVKDIPKNVAQLDISSGFINFNIPDQSIKKNYVNRLAFNLPVTSRPSKVMPPDAIQNAILMLSLYQMQERAREEMGKGDIASATRHLEILASHLLETGKEGFAESVMNEVDFINQNRSFSEEGEKRIKYSTRSLLLPSRNEES